MKFLHDEGVVHGGLKPKNILVTFGGRAVADTVDQNVANFDVKVADFGLVGTKMKSRTLVSSQVRHLEMVRWRAPELWDPSFLKENRDESSTDSDWDSDSSDGKIAVHIHESTYDSDVYNFALTCSQILTGEDPYLGLGLNDLVRDIPLGLRPELPTTHTCPPFLRDLIQRCWSEKNRRPRFYSILSNLKILQASLSQAGPSSEPYLSDLHPLVDIKEKTMTELPLELTNVPGKKGKQEVDIPKGHEEGSLKVIQGESTVNMSDYLKMAQALAGKLPSGDKVILYRRQCSFLQKRLLDTLDLVEKRVGSYRSRVQYGKVFKELHLLVQKVKTFAEDCCYEDHGINFVFAAIRVTAHKERFYKYHVELDWCLSLVTRLGGHAHSEEFNWEHKFKLILEDTSVSSLIADDERELEDQLGGWIAKRGQHQAICWTLLRRLSSRGRDTMPDDLGAPPFASLIFNRKCKIIGEGAFGTVYGIEWNRKGFAVKVLDESVANTEVEILADCCHPHIVNLILARKEDSSQYLMMDRLSMDLMAYIKKRFRRERFNREDIFDPFTPLEIVDMISQICDGMVYLSEEKKVSHRDLKPQNILVKEGAVLELQVADFGWAKVRQETEFSEEYTPNYGATRYRAPEMSEPGGAARNKIRGMSSMKADMYSFAVTCSILLTGREPFCDFALEAIPGLVKGGMRPDLPDNCPRELSSLLQQCWHPDPSERPPSFTAIRKDLRKLKANLLISGDVASKLFKNPQPTQPPKKDRPLRRSFAFRI